MRRKKHNKKRERKGSSHEKRSPNPGAQRVRELPQPATVLVGQEAQTFRQHHHLPVHVVMCCM